MNEADLKRALVKAIKKRIPRATVLRHEDKFRAGIPDLSVTVIPGVPEMTRVVWVEVKFDRAGARGRMTPLQERMLRRLAGLLVLYKEDSAGTRGVQVGDDTGWILAWRPGFAHDQVAEAIARRLE